LYDEDLDEVKGEIIKKLWKERDEAKVKREGRKDSSSRERI